MRVLIFSVFLTLLAPLWIWSHRILQLLQPIIHFEYGEAHVEKTFRKIAADIGVRGRKVTKAIKKAQETQKNFYKHLAGER